MKNFNSVKRFTHHVIYIHVIYIAKFQFYDSKDTKNFINCII
jgi:hypothetical protein